MAKKVAGYLKLQIPAGKAAPAPPVGPALGQRGINIMEFCKAFNAATGQIEQGTPTPVVITCFTDKSFSFETRSAPASYYLLKAANVKSGSSTPSLSRVGSVTWEQVKEIAEAKMKDLNAHDLEAAGNIIAGSARSMGIEVKGE